MQMTRNTLGLAAMLLVIGLVGACTQNGSSQGNGGTTGTNASNSSPLPTDFMLTSMPTDVTNVGAAKGKVKAGDSIAVRGRIGGSSSPFIEGRAAFTIVDNSLKACSDVPGDMCQQPWDYCCETKDSLARNTATITVVSAEGKPLPMSLSGVNGLKELSDVVVVGKVAQAEGNVLLINATGVYIAQ